jgi:hypothetical protein
VDFHRISPDSPFRSIGIRYMFPSFGHAFSQEATAQMGFTHLLGGIKSHPTVTARLERRIASLDPSFHRHCQRMAQFSAIEA